MVILYILVKFRVGGASHLFFDGVSFVLSFSVGVPVFKKTVQPYLNITAANRPNALICFTLRVKINAIDGHLEFFSCSFVIITQYVSVVEHYVHTELVHRW